MREDTTVVPLKGAIQVNENELKDHVKEVVRGSVEETLNALLDAEADAQCRAGRYEHSPDRTNTRMGHYERKLETQAGDRRAPRADARISRSSTIAGIQSGRACPIRSCRYALYGSNLHDRAARGPHCIGRPSRK